MEPTSKTFVVFVGTDLVGRGALADVALTAKRWHDKQGGERIAVFDEDSGQPLDLDLSGSDEEMQARLSQHPVVGEHGATAGRGPGRPKLGVVSREVSLLPRHWGWLGQQRGGASATLRRLVDAASKASVVEEAARRAIDAAHRFMWDIAGDLPAFEEASRALYARDFDAFDRRIALWPAGIQEQLWRFTQRARKPAPQAV